MSIKGKTRFIVPEVIQTSNMDCGPAALKSVLGGLSRNVSYGRLRDACQTDVDGTSIDTLEEILMDLGVDAEQVMIPVDHLFLQEPAYLPAIVVIELSNGNTHFVVFWRKHGNWIQVMDPATGRRWIKIQDLMEQVYRHTMAVGANEWREWVGSEEFTIPLKYRIQAIGVSASETDRLIKIAAASQGWKRFAFLDATVRMLEKLARTGALSRGPEISSILLKLMEDCDSDVQASGDLVPDHYWFGHEPSALKGKFQSIQDKSQVLMTGAVAIHIKGFRRGKEQVQPRSPILSLALREEPLKPIRFILGFVRESGKHMIPLLFAALLVSSIGVLIEGLMFFSLIEINENLNVVSQRLFFFSLVLSLSILILVVQFPITRQVARLGRQLEIRIRRALYLKLPRIGDQYFRSRLHSDMAERSHMLFAVRSMPSVVEQLIVGLMGILACSTGLIILLPRLAPWLLALISVIIVLPLLMQPLVSERDLQVRSHLGALSNFYLDALKGLVPIRLHSAENTIQDGHESRLKNWAQSERNFLRLQVLVQFIQLSGGVALTWVLVSKSIDSLGQDPVILLMIYWIVSIPLFGLEFNAAIVQYPAFRNVMLRILDPLYAPENHIEKPDTDTSVDDFPDDNGQSLNAVSIHFRDVSVKAGGNYILKDIDFNIEAGEHIAVVGESGAGKSSLAGLILGWLTAESGSVSVNGMELNNRLQARLRDHIAWIDPSVQLWNSSLHDNLSYGSSGKVDMSCLLSQAELLDLLSSLKDGLASNLGEGGSLISGGEGQRVRIGRALNRLKSSCVILDEPFRGLDREHRNRLQANLFRTWRHSTIVYITHDIAQTRNFSRVIVMNRGRCVEDDSPERLLERSSSTYSKLFAEYSALESDLWGNDIWRNWNITDGKLECEN